MWLQCLYKPLSCSLALHSVVLWRLFSIEEAGTASMHQQMRPWQLQGCLALAGKESKACQQVYHLATQVHMRGRSRSCLIA
jgi:hypothetical protein